MTAAELALGLLEGEERAAAIRRQLADPGFAREVEDWRAQFETMSSEVLSVEPPARVLDKIETALWPRRRGKWVWPAVTAALAASLVAAVLLRPEAPVVPAGSGAALVATLDRGGKGSPIAAIYDRGRGEIRIASAGLAVPGRSAELWMIGHDGVPHSLGLLATGDRAIVAVAAADRRAMVPGTKLAISSEPQGGSPVGKPTGPIQAIGTFISV
ncbi:anti-sigma factor [Novosphingobium sp. G106]|uniref:anti-sigma factor n=1 Tax=Novosphingobium sp. G106 TaxID=2849500 RepID=UPI001C2D0403|nr:anti-sigma factor [Novosphingobium sp. G106]MBV1687750.1 anti-sigma factor [Novosphingobium sp. G106]